MVYRRSDTWFTHLGGRPEIDGGQLVGHEVHGPAAVGGGRADRDRFAAQALRDPQPAALEGHPAAQPHAAALAVGPVGQGRQLGRIGAGADAIATGGDGQGQRLVGPDLVVLMPPGVEAGLPGGQIGPRRLPAEVALEGAVEALVLAQRLGVVRAAVADGDAQAAQPDGQRGVGMGRVVAPRTAVVDQQAVRQPVALEGRDQVSAHGGGALVGTGDQAEGIARVVVQDRQGMTAPGAAAPPGPPRHSAAATCSRSSGRSQSAGTTPAGWPRVAAPTPQTPPAAPSSIDPRTAPAHTLMAPQGVHHVSERVSMMSPVYTPTGRGRKSRMRRRGVNWRDMREI